jgi:hypothetical protein
MKTGTVTLAAFLLLAGTAAPQSPVQPVRAEIPFAFHAAGKTMPAGVYQIIKQVVPAVVLNGPGGTTITLPVLTYLGRHDTDTEPELVFDKLEGNMHLSEVWLPGQDGLLLLGTKERHDHAVLKGGKK